MKAALCTIAYNEERFIKPFLEHIPDWVEEKLVLLSAQPWMGEYELPDETDKIAESLGANVVVHPWANEEEQRNTGQELLEDFDWIIVLDPDEFLSDLGWRKLEEFLELNISYDAFVPARHWTYWKNRMVVEPPEDHKPIILVRPSVRFVDKRVVGCGWAHAPVSLHHFSWARTDDEVWSKISHYSHSDEFDKEKWFNEVWKSDKTENLHPVTPEAIRNVSPLRRLPKNLERLKLWP